jgi:integrase
LKWTDTHRVEGADPPVLIGRPLRSDHRTGQAKAGRLYHMRYTVAGRQVSKSLGTGNKKEAIRRVFEHQARLRAGEADGSDEKRALTLGEALDEYLGVCRDRDLSPKTLEKYELVIRDLKKVLGHQVNGSVADFGEREFTKYEAAMRKAGLQPKTRYDRLVVVRQAFRYLARNRRIAYYPLEGRQMRKPQSKPQPCFTRQQVEQLLTAADPYLRPIFAVLAYCGLRFGELRDLPWEDVHLNDKEGGVISVRRGGSGDTTKDREERHIPIHRELRAILQGVRRRGERVFCDVPSRKDPQIERPLVERKLLMELKKLCGACGFENPKQYKLHTFRHFFASTCAARGIPHKYALKWMGHSDSRILDLYLTLYDDVAQRLMNGISFMDPKRSAPPPEDEAA